jgi:hypothetical protein
LPGDGRKRAQPEPSGGVVGRSASGTRSRWAAALEAQWALDHRLDLLVQATLLTDGLHKHGGSWRPAPLTRTVRLPLSLEQFDDPLDLSGAELLDGPLDGRHVLDHVFICVNSTAPHF